MADARKRRGRPLLRTTADFRIFQPGAVDFMVNHPRCAALLRPGLGKTICGLTARQRLGARRTLIAAPAQVVESGVWSQEAAQWEHTAHLRVVELSGPPAERELDIILGGDITVVSYDLLGWLTDRITDKKHVRNNYFDSIIYDELSKMKHPGTKRFKRMRAWAQNIPIRFGLTGSPLGNSWQDIWGEMFITAGAAALGPTQEEFLDTYFKQVPRPGSRWPAWEIRTDGSADAIKSRIRPYAFSISKKLAAKQLPEVVYAPLHLKMPLSCQMKEAELREEMEVELASGTTLYALSQSKLGQLIRQFASGAVYTNEERTEWEEVHDVKIRAVRDRIDEMQGEPLLIFAWFRHSKERLVRDFKFEVFKGTADQVARWNRKEIPGLIANPQGSGMGLNLQYGGSSVFWFDPEWSREKLDQGNGRLARLGQVDPFVTSSIALVGDLDARIWRRLQEKGQDEEGLIESVALPEF
jgi:SNF2 family DNA or RNA helicase